MYHKKYHPSISQSDSHLGIDTPTASIDGEISCISLLYHALFSMLTVLSESKEKLPFVATACRVEANGEA
jgi:hypothetical protein